MNPQFEKYLLGEMGEVERAEFEDEMKQNPELREQFDRDHAFIQSLQNLMLRRRINSAIANLDKPESLVKPRFKSWLPWLGLGILLVIVAGVVWRSFHLPSSSISKESLPQQKINVPQIPVDTPKGYPEQIEEEKQKKRGPIAQTSVEPHSLQRLRGQQPTANSPWKELVLKIWDTPFPFSATSFGERFYPTATYLLENNVTEAYLSLRKIEQQNNSSDTLSFLQGYCLLQLWEGEAALSSFNAISKTNRAWSMEIEWYTGLCHLLRGKKDEAILVFKEIVKQPKQVYRPQAKRALKLLEE